MVPYLCDSIFESMQKRFASHPEPMSTCATHAHRGVAPARLARTPHQVRGCLGGGTSVSGPGCLGEPPHPDMLRSPGGDTCQPLALPHTGRFCSQFFLPEAEWTDAFSVPWGGENNWLLPPCGMIAQAVSHLCASRAVGTLVVPYTPWAPWLSALRRGRQWSPILVGFVRLGSPGDCLRIPREHRRDFGPRCVIIALGLDSRLGPDPGGASGPGAP